MGAPWDSNIEVGDVVAVVREHEPCTIAEIHTALGAAWEKRGTVRNRVYMAVDQGFLICDENRPMRFALRDRSIG